MMTFRATDSRMAEKQYHALSNVENQTKAGLRKGWYQFARGLKDTANKEILRAPKSGRIYILRDRLGRRRRHVASAPGETHANLTGVLRRALGYNVTNWERMEFGYGISTRSKHQAPDYAQIEFGFGRIAPRPSLRIAIDREVANVETYFRREVNAEYQR